MFSFWEKSEIIGRPNYVVIGSGIVGINAALELKRREPKSDVLIVEAGPLPAGASTKNAGFACFGSPSELLMDLKSHAETDVFSLVKERLDGLKLLRNIVGDDMLDYLELGSYEMFLDKDKESYAHCMHQLDYLNTACKQHIGFSPYQIDTDIIGKNAFNNFCGAISISGEGQINTGKMMNYLLNLCMENHIRILNGLKTEQINRSDGSIEISTSYGVIICDKCIIATNGFAKQLIPELNIEPARAQVLITKPLKNLNIKGTFHFDEGYFYFRNIGERILFGGGRNLDFDKENTSDQKLNTNIQSALIDLLKSHILPNQDFEIEHQWTGIMGVGDTKKPFIQHIDQDVVCGVKLGGMGVAIGTKTGIDAANLLLKA